MTVAPWTEDRLEKLRKCRDAGMTQAEAGATLGVSEYSVNRIVARFAIIWKYPSDWTDAMLEDLKLNWRDGLSCALNAEALNKKYGTKFTRNATIGKLHRLGLKSGKKAPKLARMYPVGRRQENLAIARAAKAAAPPKLSKAVKADKPAPAPVLVPVSANMVNLIGLTSRKCHFPVTGEGADTLFCGDGTDEGHTYCAGHHRVVYLPKAQQKERRRLSEYVARKYG